MAWTILIYIKLLTIIFDKINPEELAQNVAAYMQPQFILRPDSGLDFRKPLP
jgi:hypothetical protein